MTQTPTYSYDKDVDILYISFCPGEKATAAVELNDFILLRYNRKEKRPIGLTLQDFSVLAQLTELGPRNFPLTGLNEIEPQWRNEVVEIIKQPPVNQFLKVSAFIPTINEITPIAFVERPDANLAMAA